MTSKPASLNELAITFAPRSCPSSPGFATSTRILRSVIVPVMENGLPEGYARRARPATARHVLSLSRSGHDAPRALLENGQRVRLPVLTSRDSNQPFRVVRERRAVPVPVVSDGPEAGRAQQSVDLRGRAQSQRMTLLALLASVAPAPEPSLVADAGHGVEPSAHADLRAVREPPAVTLRVGRNDLVAMHALEKQRSARCEHAPRLGECPDVLGVIEEQAEA